MKIVKNPMFGVLCAMAHNTNAESETGLLCAMAYNTPVSILEGSGCIYFWR